MLVLSRKIDEAIIIDSNIKVYILGIDDEKVRIGIEAPKSVRILRDELLRETIDLNKEAANTPVFKMPNAVTDK